VIHGRVEANGLGDRNKWQPIGSQPYRNSVRQRGVDLEGSNLNHRRIVTIGTTFCAERAGKGDAAGSGGSGPVGSEAIRSQIRSMSDDFRSYAVGPLASLSYRVGQPTKSAQPTVFVVGCASQARLTHPDMVGPVKPRFWIRACGFLPLKALPVTVVGTKRRRRHSRGRRGARDQEVNGGVASEERLVPRSPPAGGWGDGPGRNRYDGGSF
jgi:hypothetical protein